MSTDRSQYDSQLERPLDGPHGASRGEPRPLHALVTPGDVELARRAGMDPRDVSALRQFAADRFLIVVRCPRVGGAPAEGARRAKPRRPRPKGGASRALVAPRSPAPAPCDLMSVWKLVGGRPAKVRLAPRRDDPLAGPSFDATMIVLELNSRLVARVGPACQDDDPSPARAPIAAGDRFIAFGHDGATFLPDAAACAAYYREHGLDWPHER